MDTSKLKETCLALTLDVLLLAQKLYNDMVFVINPKNGGLMSTLTFIPEVRAFLLEATRTGKLATVRSDGRAHVVPIWFLLDGDTIVFTTGEGTLKAKNMRRDPRVCLCVDDEHPMYSYATIEGTITFSENMQELAIWATRIAARYMGEQLAEQYGKRNAVPGELLVRITPTKILFQKDVAS